MTAYVSTDRYGTHWTCEPCGEYQPGYVDEEDAQDAADDHNKHKHRGDNPDDDYYDKYREDRRGTR